MDILTHQRIIIAFCCIYHYHLLLFSNFPFLLYFQQICFLSNSISFTYLCQALNMSKAVIEEWRLKLTLTPNCPGLFLLSKNLTLYAKLCFVAVLACYYFCNSPKKISLELTIFAWCLFQKLQIVNMFVLYLKTKSHCSAAFGVVPTKFLFSPRYYVR